MTPLRTPLVILALRVPPSPGDLVGMVEQLHSSVPGQFRGPGAAQ